MGAFLTARDGSALFGLLADNSEDIILKADREGFIDPASLGLELIGVRLGECLIPPRLADIADPDHADALTRYHAAVIGGGEHQGWLEFPIAAGGAGRRWFRLALRPVTGRHGTIHGVVGMMRCIDDRRALEDQLFAAAMTDPLTGLANRGALVAMLEHLVDQPNPGCIAIFTLEGLRRLNLSHGQAAGDEMLRAVAELMRTVLRRDHILGRIGGDSFAVLMPRVDLHQAEQIAGDFVVTFMGLSSSERGETGPVRISGGVAAIQGSVDESLRQADAALVRARAGGGARVGRAVAGRRA